MNPEYQRYHPKWYRRRMPIFWWLGKWPYIKFIGREMTSAFVAYAALVLLVQVWTIGHGAAAYQAFQDWLASPVVIGVHAAVLAIVVFHSVTWLSLAPQALVVKLGKRRVPDAIVLLAHYGAWLLASVVVVWFFVRA